MARSRSHRGRLKPVDVFGIFLAIAECAVAVLVLSILAGAISITETTTVEEPGAGITIIAFFSAIVGLAATSMSLTVARSARRLPMWTRVLIVTFPAVVAVLGILLCCAVFLAPGLTSG